LRWEFQELHNIDATVLTVCAKRQLCHRTLQPLQCTLRRNSFAVPHAVKSKPKPGPSPVPESCSLGSQLAACIWHSCGLLFSPSASASSLPVQALSWKSSSQMQGKKSPASSPLLVPPLPAESLRLICWQICLEMETRTQKINNASLFPA